MATLSDFMNDPAAVLNDPRMQLGLSLLGQSGWQAGNPGLGQRLGAGAMNFYDLQRQSQATQSQQQLRQIQAQELEMRQKALQQEQARQAAIGQYVQQNPEFLASNPLARLIAGTGDLGGAAEAMQAGRDPTAPKQPFQYQTPDLNGMITTHTYNPQTGGYEVSAPIPNPDVVSTQISKQNADTNLMNAQTNQQKAEADIERSMQEQRDKQAKQLRESQANVLKSQVDQTKLSSAYQSSNTQLLEDARRARELANDPGLRRIFGIQGAVPNIPGTVASNLQATLDQLKSQTGLRGLVQLEQQGIKLTPVSNTDLSTAANSVANFDQKQSPESAKQRLLDYATNLERIANDATQTYNQTINLGTQTQQQNAARPTTQSEYDALPSGTIYIDTDGQMKRKR